MTGEEYVDKFSKAILSLYSIIYTQLEFTDDRYIIREERDIKAIFYTMVVHLYMDNEKDCSLLSNIVDRIYVDNDVIYIKDKKNKIKQTIEYSEFHSSFIKRLSILISEHDKRVTDASLYKRPNDKKTK